MRRPGLGGHPWANETAPAGCSSEAGRAWLQDASTEGTGGRRASAPDWLLAGDGGRLATAAAATPWPRQAWATTGLGHGKPRCLLLALFLVAVRRGRRTAGR